MKVSYSRASCYSFCPSKHYFSYVMKLRLKKPVKPLFFGSDFHKLLELRHNPKQLKSSKKEIKETFNDMPAIHQMELGDNYVDDLFEIFKDYTELYKDAEKPIETEHEFLVQIGKYKGEPIFFHGKIDEIYEDLKMGEHKTFNRKPDLGILTMNTQACLYSKAWEIEKGKKFSTVSWDYIRNVPATKPIWLSKSERFSEAKSQSITPYSWLRACDEKGITDKKIRAIAQNYEPNISNYFFKYDVEILPAMVDSIWDSFIDVVKDMVKRGSTNRTKNVTRECSYCNYRALCYAEFTGVDTDYIIETDYIVKDESEDDTIEEIQKRINKK